MLKLLVGTMVLYFVLVQAKGADTTVLNEARSLLVEMMFLRTKRVELALAKREAALALLKRAPDPALKPSLLAELTSLQMQYGNVPLALQRVDQGILLATQQKEAVALRALRILRISFEMNKANTAASTASALQVLKEADASAVAVEAGDDYLQSTLLLNRSIIYAAMERTKEDTAALVEAEALARVTGNRRVLMSAEVNLSDTLLQRKDYQGALEMAERGLKLAKSLGDNIHVGVALLNKGAALTGWGNAAVDWLPCTKRLPSCTALAQTWQKLARSKNCR